jgi:membrane protein
VTRFPTLLRTIRTRVKAHNAVIMAAGIAFYATLAMVPTLLALVSVYALLTEPSEIEDQINRLAGGLDQATADLVKKQLTTAVEEAKGAGAVMFVVGLLLALLSASGAVQKLMLSINLAYGAVEGRKAWRVRGLAYAFTTAAIAGVVVIVFLLGALPRVMDEINLSGPTQVVLNVLRFPVLGLAMVAGLTVLYRFGPHRNPRTAWRNPGALVATAAFLIFAGLFALYFSFAGGMPASYGILGSIAAIIIFFQLGALAVIIGAEVNAAAEGSIVLPLGGRGVESTNRSVAEASPAPMGFGRSMTALIIILVLGKRRT